MRGGRLLGMLALLREYVLGAQSVEFAAEVWVGGIDRHARDADDVLVVLCRPFNHLPFFVNRITQHAHFFNSFAHDFCNVLQPIVDGGKLLFNEALELPKGIEQLSHFVRFELIRHRKRYCLNLMGPGKGGIGKRIRAAYASDMAEEPRKRRDRYDVSGGAEEQYVNAAQTVLVNKRGITDLESLQTAEEQALARAYGQLLGEVHVDTPMTGDLLRHIHAAIFGDLYDWAGRSAHRLAPKAWHHVAPAGLPERIDGGVRANGACTLAGESDSG